jgi:BMFP domain-containing protein YqiC
MSDGSAREMTLGEWMARLPSCHAANKELAELKDSLKKVLDGQLTVRDAISRDSDSPEHSAEIASKTRQERDKLKAQHAAAMETLREVAEEWSSCPHYGGCLPSGVSPRPKAEWCGHCTVMDMARAQGDE